MTTTYSSKQGKGTLTITFSAVDGKASTVLEAATKHAYSLDPLPDPDAEPGFGGMIPYEDLTMAQRLAALDRHIKQYILSLARQQHEDDIVRAAQAQARARAQADFDLN